MTAAAIDRMKRKDVDLMGKYFFALLIRPPISSRPLELRGRVVQPEEGLDERMDGVRAKSLEMTF